MHTPASVPLLYLLYSSTSSISSIFDSRCQWQRRLQCAPLSPRTALFHISHLRNPHILTSLTPPASSSLLAPYLRTHIWLDTTRPARALLLFHTVVPYRCSIPLLLVTCYLLLLFFVSSARLRGHDAPLQYTYSLAFLLRSPAFWVLGSAFCVLRSAFCRVLRSLAFCVLRSAFCVLNLFRSVLRLVCAQLTGAGDFARVSGTCAR